MFKRLIPTLALGLLTVWPAGAVPGPSAPTLWTRTAHDAVAAPSQTSAPAAARHGNGAGYATEVDAVLPQFVVHLSPSAEAIRGEVLTAVSEAAAAGGLAFDMAPGNTPFDDTPAEREIHVTVSDSSPCGPLGDRTVGCGGHLYRDIDGRRTVVAGLVWIAPNLEARGRNVLRETVLHEFGHALGLDHYDDAHDGQFQVMRSVVGGGDGRYRSGDRSGLAGLGRGH